VFNDVIDNDVTDNDVIDSWMNMHILLASIGQMWSRRRALTQPDALGVNGALVLVEIAQGLDPAVADHDVLGRLFQSLGQVAAKGRSPSHELVRTT